MLTKTLYSRFRTWQQQPHRYSDQNMARHCCANCGQEYNGNYCPVCGQEGKRGRVTWRSVAENFMRIWNLESHSFPVTLWQMLWRPGYLISDYNRGRQQAYYPPINMLLAVAVIYAVFAYLFGFENEMEIVGAGEVSFLKLAFSWIAAHPAWAMMIMTMIMILPTWLLFRFAPRNAGYTLPENVFIQLYLSSLMLLCNLLSNLFSWFILLIPIYYFVTYRQLFGYSFWGTLWRLLFCVVVWMNIFISVFIFLLLSPDSGSKQSPTTILTASATLLAIAAVVLFVGYLFSKKRKTENGKR